MKRFLAIILTGLMLLSLAACGGKKDDVDYNFGMVFSMYNTREFYNHINETHGDSKLNSVLTQFDNLNAALMALNSKYITALSVDEEVAAYITAMATELGIGSCILGWLDNEKIFLLSTLLNHLFAFCSHVLLHNLLFL